MTSNRLEGKVALITGAASGLGREIALNYASHGAKLVIIADLTAEPSLADMIEGEDVEYTAAKINRLYGDGKAAFVKCNVTEADDVKNAIQEAVRLGGRLDIHVNNAGIAGVMEHKPFHLSDDDNFDKTINVNVKGTYLGSKWALAQMVEQEPDASGKRGRLLNIASIYGLIGVAGGGMRGTAYSTSKGAVMNMTRTLALEYRSQGINVNALCPGFLKTALNNGLYEHEGMTAMLAARGGWGEVGDIAHAAAFLVSDEANWVNGVGMPIDGGFTAG